MTNWKAALVAIASVVAASQAEAQSTYRAVGSVLDQPIFTVTGNTGRITFADARLDGIISLTGSGQASTRYEALLDLATDFDLGQTILSDGEGQAVITGLGSAPSFFGRTTRTTVRFADGVYSGVINVAGNAPARGLGFLSVRFRGNEAEGFTSTFDLSVPEPATWGMMILGFGAIGMSVRRRRVHFAAA